MKDAAHHLRHIQRKIIRSTRKEEEKKVNREINQSWGEWSPQQETRSQRMLA